MEKTGILSRAQETRFQNDYYSAEERARLAYMTVKTEIMANRASNGTYDATNATNAEALKQLVAKDLTGDGWEAPTVENNAIKVTYINASIKAGGISTNPDKPKYNGKVEFSIGLTAKDATLSVDGVQVSGGTADSGSGSESGSGGSGSSSTLPAGTYTAGQEVTFGGEQFFVLSDSGNSVTLLAKYCLNQAGTEQVNAGSSTYGRRFSKTNYWRSDYDLQNSSNIGKAEADGDAAEGIPNAVLAAQSYGTAKGVTGRLMTHAEANGIENGRDQTMKNILYGRWTGEGAPTQGYLCFWLGAAYNASDVWFVNGNNSNLNNNNYNNTNNGVRPAFHKNLGLHY